MTGGRPLSVGLPLVLCRNRRATGTWTPALLLAGVLAGCGSGSGGPSAAPRAEWVHRGPQCSPGEAVAVDLERAEKAGFTLPGRVQPGSGSGRFVAVGLGEFPTAGYAISLAEVRQDPETGRVIVRVRAETPPEGSAVAQVLTFPCGVLRVTGPGSDRPEVEVELGSKHWPIGDPVSR